MSSRDSALVGTGWSFPMGVNLTGGIRTVGGVDEIEQAIFLILATTPGERPMRPEFGCALIDFVFAPIDADTFGQIAFAVDEAVRRWEPRVEVGDVLVDVHPGDPNAVLIDLTYTIRDTYDRRSLVFPFYVIPDHEE